MTAASDSGEAGRTGFSFRDRVFMAFERVYDACCYLPKDLRYSTAHVLCRPQKRGLAVRLLTPRDTVPFRVAQEFCSEVERSKNEYERLRDAGYRTVWTRPVRDFRDMESAFREYVEPHYEKSLRGTDIQPMRGVDPYFQFWLNDVACYKEFTRVLEAVCCSPAEENFRKLDKFCNLCRTLKPVSSKELEDLSRMETAWYMNGANRMSAEMRIRSEAQGVVMAITGGRGTGLGL